MNDATNETAAASSDSLFGEVIHSYSRAQSIEDGVLVDLNAVAGEVCRQHYPAPVACTSAVWAIIDKAVKNPRWCNDLNGVVHDVLWMSRCSGARVGPFAKVFRVIITGAGRRSTYELKIMWGPDEEGRICFTVMLSEED